MDSSNFVKNLTSKDIQLSHQTLKELIESGSLEKFKELCEKGDYIFPFLKQRICDDFVKLLNKENLKTVFEFSKIYSDDFSSLIVNSWVKFASEDLTDEILELLENGTNEQKAYCALYFTKIKDPLAIEYLNSYYNSSFSPLKINTARALCSFKDETKLKEAMNEVLETEDEFNKLNIFEFICAYKSKAALDFTLENCFSCDFSETIILNLLDTYDFEYLKNNISKENISRIFQELLEGFPEEISLTTIEYYQILDYIEFFNKNQDDFRKNLLLKAKKDFNLYLQDDIYNYDLDKNTKNILIKITELLNKIEININLENELNNFNCPYRFKLALDIVKEYNLKEYSKLISDLINNNKLNETFLAEAISTEKALDCINLIDTTIIQNIKNENIRAYVENIIN